MMQAPWWLWMLAVAASVPVLMTAMNLLFYRRLRRSPASSAGPGVSVLIPARNEEASIGAAVDAVLASRGVTIELIVLDDASTDGTGDAVRRRMSGDGRLKLEKAPPLPSGWCGKQHACHVLASLAAHETMVFLDADVRVERDALARLSHAMRRDDTALLSGFPAQQTNTLAEKLLIPLMHTVLLGYLPLPGVRWTRHPAFAAGCGQMMAVRRDAYRSVGGHGAIRTSLHDGILLPRAFRRSGFRTDLFDATDAARCRMYRSAAEVWAGLSKNAREGMATPMGIAVWSLLLFGGHIAAPLVGMGLWMMSSSLSWLWTPLLMAPWALRLVQSVRFRQSLVSAVLHPAGIMLLLVIQWHAFLRDLRGLGPSWKDRDYAAAP